VIEVNEDVPVGHKIALTTIEVNQGVIKYGYSIGKASKQIQQGEWVHTKNLVTA
jgi:altronate hydrolase